ncbi:uncharacterized protein LOC115710989 [Cannabis sativa]|uniref:uncharacterized protein LOC115710989 n=1 Tax=Cannabis sativa TaxID=3483 RepID=UPI0029CA3E3B|nr:uncharacterized protein LOC115710989 [Cannabis sativa]
MNILSWNARGLGNPKAFRHLKLLVRQQSPQVLFLMETRLGSNAISRFRQSLQFKNGLESPRFLIGDFNEILSQSDKLGGSLRNESQIEAFRNTLDHCHLQDLPYEGDRFTWVKNRKAVTTIKERLDWVFTNHLWSSIFEVPTVSHLDFFSSDHRAIATTVTSLHSTAAPPQKHSRFRFEKLWLADPESKEIISSCWSDVSHPDSITNITQKLECCAKSLQQWHIRKYGHMKKRIDEAQSTVTTLNNISNHSPTTAASLKTSESILDDLLEQEEMYWQQRSRIDWLQLGDRNTKFFHSKASARKANNKIKFLQTEGGLRVTSKHDMAEAIQDYFEGIFQSSSVDEDALAAIIHSIPTTITQEMNSDLTKPFTPSEVKDALFSMGSDKSPGIDGMSAMFYQQHWDIVGDSVCSAVLNVLNHGADPTPLNSTMITLIPKKKKLLFVKDYRPIALCNVISKLITKVLVGRFKPVLPLVISETQSAFLPNCLITDNILVAFELIHGIKLRTSGRKGVAAMKLDMSKAFDRVEWCFIQRVMEKMGFWFSRLLQHEELSGNLHGYKLTRRAEPISHLLFTDDSLLFCHADGSSCLSIKRVRDIYHRASGQTINAEKSNMSFSPNTTLAAQIFFHRTLSMPITDCHETYLGLPAYSGRDKQHMFSDIKEKVWRLMNSWNEKIFSSGGKEILLKAVVQSIPTYAMSCFRLPTTKGRDNAVVANLITEDRQWDVALLNQYFIPADVERTLTIPLSYFPSNDCLVWHHTNNGIYTVQSGYHLASSLAEQPHSSSSSSESKWWKSFWSLQLPEKIKIFAWHVIHDALPVATSLVKQKVITDAACSVCRQAWESVGHVFFGCHYAKNVWRLMHQSFDWKKAVSMYKGDYLKFLASSHTKAEFEQIICTLWCIWSERNQVVHNKKSHSASALAAFSLQYLDNYHAAQLKYRPPATSSQVPSPSTAPSAPWQPPPMGTLKLNIDAAFDKTSSKIGVGAVIRNYVGQVIAALSMPIVGNFASNEMEAKAMFHGINWVLQQQLSISIVETDALVVSNALKSPAAGILAFSDLIMDISYLLSFFPNTIVTHVKRNANSVADSLAKFALGLDEICSWWENFPPSIYSVIVNDSF